jgi:hypothetical protein
VRTPVAAGELFHKVRYTQLAALGDNGSFVMANNDRDLFLVRSLKSFQENVRQAGPAAGASYTLIGAIMLLGGIGYALDTWRGTSPWFLLGGLLLGLIVGFYELAMTVFRR